jgi:hypothetical protein
MELGLRLRSAGWTLRRIAVRSLLHHGRSEGNWPLLLRRWRSRYLDGAGELLRAALGKKHFMRAAATQRHLFVALLIWLGLLGGLVLWPWSHALLLVTALIVVMLVAWRTVRTRSIADACFGQLVWQVTALAMVRGFLAQPRNPRDPVDYIVVKPGENQ